MKKTFILLVFTMLCGVMYNTAYPQRYWNAAAKVSGSKYVAMKPYSTLASISGSFTMECWFKASGAGAATLFGKDGLRLLIQNNGPWVQGRIQTNNNTKLTTRYTNQLPYNTWFHLACTYDSTTDAIKFYINGYLDTSSTTTNGPNPGTDSIFIGKSSYGQAEVIVDDMKIWDYARTAAEIRENMRQPYAGAIVASGPLLMHAGFDNTSSGPFYPALDCYDGYNQYFVRGGEPVDIGKAPSNTIFGNTALKVDGVGDYMRMRTHPDIELAGSITMEAWIYPDTVDANIRYILAKKGGWNNPGYAMYYQNGKVRVKMNGVGNFTIADIPPKKWTHIAAAISNSGSGFIYINGKQDTELGVGIPGANSDSLYIGGFPLDAGYFKGYVDAVKISNFQKTAQEVQRSMFEIVDNTNDPSAPNSTVSINFDYNCLYNQYSGINGGPYSLMGNAGISKPAAVENVPVSPVLGANVSSFPEGYTIKASDRRIPEFNTAGYMKEDTLSFPSSMSISDVNFFLALNHDYHADLKIQLFSPQGDSITIWNQDAGAGTYDHIITVFDDQADTGLTYEQVDFGPRIKPNSSLNNKFTGENSAGNWRLRITDFNNGSIGYLYGWGVQVNNQVLVGLGTAVNELPGTYSLEQNYPNPFNPVTTIQYSLPQQSQVRLKVYDILGKEVMTLVNGQLNAGTHKVEFNGEMLSSGVYFYKLDIVSPRDGIAQFSEVKRMVLVK